MIVNISMPKKMMRMLDKQAKVEMRNRSEMLSVMVREYLKSVEGIPTMADLYKKVSNI